MVCYSHQVITEAPEAVKVKESRAAKLLFKKVNSMINKMDTVFADLEKKEKELKKQVSAAEVSQSTVDTPASIASEELVRIDELMSAIKKVSIVHIINTMPILVNNYSIEFSDSTSSR